MPRPPKALSALVAIALGLMPVGGSASLAAAGPVVHAPDGALDDPNNPNNPNGFEQSDDPYNRDLKNRVVEPLNPMPPSPPNRKPIIP
ncbi:hypothetical protein [Segniliparus rugosus]|uniref:Uncharacterized protein n=1 Tax=Segniliparus rugosus (strain ATCC BAA-974 / DSM 45345 / CCUG 50838 / CIP 108380 / JCM 13579 / CDC 945) TaxID=679197 RepID=E5XVD1_SEGRC|nr:hypothetical protein [Segniliparus rugosus]EFV11691.1 hypothetical protein HMPREF9336_03453 [Segniliparus rugosus ATCC BAA-974]